LDKFPTADKHSVSGRVDITLIVSGYSDNKKSTPFIPLLYKKRKLLTKQTVGGCGIDIAESKVYILS